MTATGGEPSMTEKQWLRSANPQAMLKFLGPQASDRKLRLFSCACCRRAWGFARAKRLKEILPLLEGFADGTKKDKDRARAEGLGAAVLGATKLDDPQQCLGGEIWRASRKELDRHECDLGELAAAAFGWAAGVTTGFAKAKKAERAQQAIVVREMFGNPFRPVTFSANWLTSTVLTLAQHIYESREFSAMPILADALQDAGCDNEELLNHLRDPKAAHVRGCWALDLVLGKK
jgi:hypothetical protein